MMSVHAQAIPSIATGISRLKNAHSASLREKLNILDRKGTRGNGNQQPKDPEPGDNDEISRRLWLLCQTRIRPEPIKGHQIRRKAIRNTIDQPPSKLVPAGQDDDILPHYPDDFNNDAFVLAEDYDMGTSYDSYPGLPKAPIWPDDIETAVPLQASESGWSEDEKPPSDEWTHSSEGDYFYADGQGNVYPVEKHEVPEDENAGWSPTSQFTGSERFDCEENEDEQGPWDEGANEGYIMYHEVQHWPSAPGAHIHAVDGAGQFTLLPSLDDEPFDDWGD